MLPVLPIFVALRYLMSRGNAQHGRSPSILASTGRSLLWGLAVLELFVQSLIVVAFAFAGPVGPSLVTVLVLAAFGLLGVAVLFFPFECLRPLARRGRFKAVYYAAHFTLVFGRTGETYAGASLLALLALAYRGGAREEELAWVRARLAKERQAFGAFAVAHALLLLLEARADAVGGRTAEAGERRLRSRSLLGTVSYMGWGAPRAVRRLAFELLALDDARCARWSFLRNPGTRFPAPARRALRAWVRERFLEEKPSWLDRLARKRLASPALEALHARAATPPREHAEARAIAADVYAALARGEAVAPTMTIWMMHVFDVLLSPDAEGCIVPPEQRGDQAFIDATAESIAGAVFQAVRVQGVPIHTLEELGPVSYRVYAKLEADVSDDLLRLLAWLEARLQEFEARRCVLNPPLQEWHMASQVRALFRRYERTLGEAAANRVFNRYLVVQSAFAARLSNTWPRMRPLAYAVFHSLHIDAVRYGDRNAELMARNMKITRGVQ